MRKLVHIDHEPYTKWREKIFLHKELKAKGVDIEVWCLTKYFYKKIPEVVDALDVPYLTEVKNLKELKKLLKKTDIANTVFVLECLCNYNWLSCKIFRLLSSQDCFFIRFFLYGNILPFRPLKDRQYTFIQKKIIEYKERYRYLICKLYGILHGVRNFDRIFSSSSSAIKTDAINHPDYEDFIKAKQLTPIIDGNYIVFLDQYFPYHPDLKSLYKLKRLPNGKSYQKTMCDFFDYLEKTLNMPIVIAAHPKAKYLGNEFGRRKIIKYQTSNLVVNASFVICHFSNSVAYLALQEKPVAFVTTKEIESIPLMKSQCQAVANIFNKEVYNLDNVPFENVEISPIDKVYRDSYKYKFLTSKQTEHKSNIDILFNLLKEDED